MTFDPADYIGEILGEPARQMRNPVNADYQCPFINSTCTKRSQQVSGPYPMCSIYSWNGKKKERKAAEMVCVCPNRLYEAPILEDVIEHCWPGEKPEKPRLAYEVTLSQLGKIDCVIADIGPGNEVKQFVSVELQAVDITGSCYPAYSALLNSQLLETPPKYNFNWRNVYKRYIMQLIFKGFYHHHWNTRVVAVMQDVLVERLWTTGGFVESPIENSNVIFMSYRMEVDPQDPTRHKLKLVRPIGTRHMDLMQGILYREAPSREKFINKIVERL